MPVTLLASADTLDRQSGRRGDHVYLAGLAAQPDARFLVLSGLDPVLQRPSGNPMRAKTGADPIDAGYPLPLVGVRVGVAPHVMGDAVVSKVGGRERERERDQMAMLAPLRPNLWFAAADLARADLAPDPALFLGVTPDTKAARFACQITPQQRDQLARTLALDTPAEFRSLASGGGLARSDLALAGLARSLFAWHDASRHCGWCGGSTMLIDGGWKRQCAPCAKDTFPRLDPVVIMLVTDGTHCVLAHEPRYAQGMYSAIAGYIEPGEDIPHAVARETREELGLTVGAVSYLASQPWPFPHSLMIGCLARCSVAPLVIDPTEITAARWFSRDEAAHMLDRRHADGLWVPGPQAIAHHLIRAFVDGV